MPGEKEETTKVSKTDAPTPPTETPSGGAGGTAPAAPEGFDPGPPPPTEVPVAWKEYVEKQRRSLSQLRAAREREQAELAQLRERNRQYEVEHTGYTSSMAEQRSQLQAAEQEALSYKGKWTALHGTFVEGLKENYALEKLRSEGYGLTDPDRRAAVVAFVRDHAGASLVVKEKDPLPAERHRDR